MAEPDPRQFGIVELRDLGAHWDQKSARSLTWHLGARWDRKSARWLTWQLDSLEP